MATYSYRPSKRPSLFRSARPSSNGDPSSMAAEYDPLGGDFYYVRADIIDGQPPLEQQQQLPTSPDVTGPNARSTNVRFPWRRSPLTIGPTPPNTHTPPQLSRHWPSRGSRRPQGANRHHFRTPAFQNLPRKPAKQPQSVGRTVTPNPASLPPSLRIRRLRAGAGSADFISGSLNALDLSGFDTNPLSIRPQ